MDIYKIIESGDRYRMKEIADHCRKIDQVWTPFEMAVIIGRSSLPIAEKYTAWRELINNYPDSPTVEHFSYRSEYKFVSYDSYHEKLTEFMEYEKRLEALFMMQEENAVYRYEINLDGPLDYYSSNAHYLTFAEAWSSAIELGVRVNFENYNIVRLGIIKILNYDIDSIKTRCENKISAWFDLEKNLFSIHTPPGVAKKIITDPDYFKEYHNFGELFGGSFAVIKKVGPLYSPGGAFYVYIPVPFGDRSVNLNENDRFLLYEILRIINEFEPLLAPMYSKDEYITQTWSIYEILKSGGGEKELTDYWSDFVEAYKYSNWDVELTCMKFKKECDEITERLLKIYCKTS